MEHSSDFFDRGCYSCRISNIHIKMTNKERIKAAQSRIKELQIFIEHLKSKK
tara:strand:- start:233 stop:388 length:156 start_codon:yes stop_codon:yes gene_type:complete